MTSEIIELKNLFEQTRWSIEGFMQKKVGHTETQIIAFNFPNYKEQVHSIEESLKKVFLYAESVVNKNQNFANVFKNQYEIFFNDVKGKYFRGFEGNHKLGSTQSLTTEILNKRADIKKTILEEFGRLGFEQYQVTLYEILKIFKITANDMPDKASVANDIKSVAPVLNLNDLNRLDVNGLQILSLYTILYENGIIKPMDLDKFMGCFDFKHIPLEKPVPIQKTILAYALIQIEGMNKKIAKSNFDINNFDVFKTKISNPKDKFGYPKTSYFPKTKQNLVREIKAIFDSKPKT